MSTKKYLYKISFPVSSWVFNSNIYSVTLSHISVYSLLLIFVHRAHFSHSIITIRIPAVFGNMRKYILCAPDISGTDVTNVNPDVAIDSLRDDDYPTPSTGIDATPLTANAVGSLQKYLHGVR